MINKNDCFEKGLLKRGIKNTDLAKKSIKQAEFFLKEAVDLWKLQKKEFAVIALYNSFFHTSRSLLYKDGITERSHYCIARYVEEEYVSKKILSEKFLNAFEAIMSNRHEIQYSTEAVDIGFDFEDFKDICNEYINEVKKLP